MHPMGGVRKGDDGKEGNEFAGLHFIRHTPNPQNINFKFNGTIYKEVLQRLNKKKLQQLVKKICL